MFFSMKATVPSPAPGVPGLEVYIESDGDLLLLDATNYVEEAIRGFYDPYVDDPDAELAADSEVRGHFDPANETDACDCCDCPDAAVCNETKAPNNEFLLFTKQVEGSTPVALWDPSSLEGPVLIGFVLESPRT